MAELLILAARDNPDGAALVFYKNEKVAESLTYAEVLRRASASARALLDAGGRGKQVVLAHPPGLEFMVDLFGVILAGATCVPVSPQVIASVKSAEALAPGVAPAILATSLTHAASAGFGAVRDAFAELPVVTTPDMGQDPIAPTPHGTNPAIIQLTSGTLGGRKAVPISEKMMLQNFAQIQHSFDFRPEERHETVALWLPHFHDMGLFGRLECTYLGIPCHLMSPLEFVQRPLRWLSLVTQSRATVTGAPNFAFDACLDLAGTAENDVQTDLSSVRVLFCGAEPIRARTLTRFSRAFSAAGLMPEAATPCYGMAEATLMATCAPVHERPKSLMIDAGARGNGRLVRGKDHEIVSCGVATLNLEVDIRAVEDGQSCCSGEIGEIVLRGDNVAPGYLGEGGTLLSDAVTADGYFRTGDLGAVVDGEVYVVGRIKTTLIVNGVNFDAHILEEAICEETDGILAVACIAWQTERGERPALVIEAAQRSAAKVDTRTLLDAARHTLRDRFGLECAAAWVVPRRGLLRTTSGKIARQTTLEQVLNGSLKVFASWHAPIEPTGLRFSSIDDLVAQIVAHAAGHQVRLDERTLRDLGVESLAAHRSAMRLHAALGGVIPMERIYAIDLHDTPLEQLSQCVDAALLATIENMSDQDAQTALERITGMQDVTA